MRIGVVGAGHVGLVVAACLADFGLDVVCVDKNEKVIEGLCHLSLPFHEPGLRDLVERTVRAERLCFSADIDKAISHADVIFIAVGTDSKPDGSVNLSAVHGVAEQIASLMEDYKVIVIKSTVPLGTAAHVTKIIKQRQTRSVDFDVVSNPEFLREGTAIETFMKPDRVVVGTSSERARKIMRDIYRPLYLIETPIVQTTNETAEVIKYVANSFLAMKISFINEMARLCDAFGCDVHDVAKAIGLDRRIGPKFLHPGPGFGGSCLPKDTQALLLQAKSAGLSMSVMEGVVRVNQQQPHRVVEKVTNCLGSLDGKVIAVFGLSYKVDTDDVRESPAIRVCELLLKAGATLRAHDPVATENARRELGEEQVVYCKSAYEAAAGADCLVILTEWNEFRNLDLTAIKSALAGNSIVDARNIFDPEMVAAMGFRYEGMGRTLP